MLSLLYKYQSMAPDVTAMFSKRAFILPTVVLIPALVGLLYQQSMYPAPRRRRSRGGAWGAAKMAGGFDLQRWWYGVVWGSLAWIGGGRRRGSVERS